MAAKNAGAKGRRQLGGLCLSVAVLLLAALPAPAPAAPTHAPLPDPLHGFALNKACGTAVDGEGDLYVSNAGEGKVEVFDPAGNHLASIANANTPCGLAVDSKGRLYVSEQATGKVVQYLPDGYPLSGSPSYGAPTVIDPSGEAKGISVDPTDDRLYVAEGTHVTTYEPDGTTGQDEVQQIYIQKGVNGGSFKLRFEGQETAPIAVDLSEAKPTDAEIQTALEALSTIGADNVEVEEGTIGARSYGIAFVHALGGENVPSLEADSSGLTGGEVAVESTLIEGFAFNGRIGESELSDADAVAAYTYSPGDFVRERRYLFVTDSSNAVKVISGKAITQMKMSNEIDGKAVPNSEECPNCAEGFGPLGAGLAANWANGHVFAYDQAHAVVDEFEASGHYLDQVHSSSFADAEPSGVAVLPQRDESQELQVLASGGSFNLAFGAEETGTLAFNATPAQVQAALEALTGIGAGGVAVSGVTGQYRVLFAGSLGNRNVGKLTVNDSGLTGTAFARAFVNTVEPGYGPERLYLSSGPGAGARLFGFGPLADPSRRLLPGLSRGLETARAVAVDSAGDVYAAAGALVHVYGPGGAELTSFEDLNEVIDLDVDSAGKVYVLDGKTEEVTYYTPSSYPPTATTTYARRGAPVATPADLPEGGASLYGIGLDPANDRLFALGFREVLELGSAAEGSPILRAEIGVGLTGFNSTLDVAVAGSNGYLYIATNPQIWVLDPAQGAHGEVVTQIGGAGSPAGSLGNNPLIAVDQGSGHIVTFESHLGRAQEFEGTGAFVAEFGEFTQALVRPKRVAIDNGPSSPNKGNVYIAFDDTKPGTPDIWAFSPLSYGQLPEVTTTLASGLSEGEATLNGTVNPEGFEVTECHFEYTAEEDFQENGFAGPGVEVAACEPEAADVGEGTEPVVVHADITGLDPEERYRFRLVAENKFGADLGQPGLFGRPLIESERVQPVLFDEATLRATIDPSGVATSYRFEYGPSEAYGQFTPAGEISSNAGKTEARGSLIGLEEGQTYHFRVVAESEAGIAVGPDEVFQTQERSAESCPNAEFRTGLSAALPDCRAYELVTPAETNGAAVGAPAAGTASFDFNHWLTVPRGPGAGESLTYRAEPTLPGFEGSGIRDGYRARRELGAHPPAGWKNELLSFSYAQAGGDGSEWRGGATDQEYSFWGIRPLSFFEGTLPKGVYLHTPGSIEPSACNPGPQPHLELVGCGSLGPDPDATPQYVSPGGAHVIFSSNVHLEDQAAPAGTTAIYDRAAAAGSGQVLSLKPDGSSFLAGEGATYVAASEDGSAVLFTVGGDLDLRREGQTVEVAAGPAAFAGLSENGGRVFYALGGGETPAALFACDLEAGPCVGGGEAGLSEIAAKGIFVGASADGSHAFFSSEDALTGSGENEAGQLAQAGKRNLYDWSNGETRFIAILDPEDFSEFGGNPALNLSGWSAALTAGTTRGRGNVPTRATPDGGVFVFQSHAQIGKYVNGGRGEIYRYSPSAPSGQRLLCLSCDSSGAQASADAMLEETPALSSNTPVKDKTIIPNVTDDGQKVFFQSSDRLVPGDANGARDVYEWRASGVGSCKRTAGCLALISAGQGEHDSYLFSMSADGHDVFIHTLDRLLPNDAVGSFSIYDAREQGGVPTAARPEEACHGDACQPPGAGQPDLVSPVTTTGPEGVRKAPPCTRGKHRVKGRCVAKKHGHHHRRPHRREKGRR